MSWDIEIGEMFKKNNQTPYMGPVAGEVISPLPDIKISILDSKVLLTKKNLYISKNLLPEGEFLKNAKIEGEIILAQQQAGSTSQESSHTHSIETLTVNTEFTAEAVIKWVDPLKPGDKVLLIPTHDQQTYFVVDVIIKL